MNLAAALLAGGRSTRMGRDKAWLDWHGEPLWQHQAKTLHALKLGPVFLSARAEQGIHDQDLIPVNDPPGGDDGPLGGVWRCLNAADCPLLVLAVDMPFMSEDFLRGALLARFDGSRGRVFAGERGFEPLAAVYVPAMLPLIQEALTVRRLGLQQVIASAVEQGLMEVLEIRPEHASLFHNVNTPDDIIPDKFTAAVPVTRWHRGGQTEFLTDITAREEPLEIRVEGRNVAVVMRTPGHDRELAAGFLLTEGVITDPGQIIDIIKCDGKGRSKGNIVDVLFSGTEVDWDSLTRHVFSASSCGLCGKTSIESVFQRFAPVQSECVVAPELLWSLPEKVRAAQSTFEKTGGLHACALFDSQGNLLVLREDVGRHNALDKVLGHGLLTSALPYRDHILFLSGRVSFEMMQKALAAQVPVVAAISAPSSLAVDFANASNQTLVGFLRERSMNVYVHGRRVNP